MRLKGKELAGPRQLCPRRILTKFEGLLATRKQLGDPAVDVLGKDIILAAVCVLPDKETHYLHQMRVQRSFVDGDVVY